MMLGPPRRVPSVVGRVFKRHRRESQLGPDRWIWRTPHGLHRLVTAEGTSTIAPAEYSFLRCFRIELALAA